MATNPRPFTESLALKEISKNEYETIYPPERIGNAANIAYGGFAVAAAVKAAALSVPDGYHLYTAMGSYLGPALTDRPLRASVTVIRQTRTFATRQVTVSQKQDDGTLRPCLFTLADFQIKEPALLEYSIPPSRQYTRHEDLKRVRYRREQMVDEGVISQKVADFHKKTFGILDHLFDTRYAPEGIFHHRLTGAAKTRPTPQDALPVTSRSTAEWARSVDHLPSYAENVSNLAFYMDAAISFMPLVFEKLFLDDVAACSSLDFALRVFRSTVDMEKWHLREMMTKVASEGRTYSEGLLWDEEGNCVASMTQQSISRKKKEEGAKGKL